MKKQIILIAIATISFWSFAGEPKKIAKNNETVKVQTTESSVKWHATKVTGEHSGTVNLQSGELVLAGNVITGGTVNIDMPTLVSTDMTGEYKGKLEGHLKSEDFFSTEKFKVSTIKIKSATAIKNATPGSDNYNIVADLTIKGITNEITFPAMIVVAKDKIIANATLDIDRTKYEIKYGSKSFFEGIGDKAIDDKFNVKVRLVAQR